jgi:hypothetical protein
MKVKFPAMKKWSIGLGYDGAIIIVEVSSINKLQVIEIVTQLFQECDNIILSQYVDTQRWDFGSKDQFINELRAKHSIDVHLGTDYINFASPEEGSTKFTVNLFGKVDSAILDRSTNFGTSNLSSIFYGITHKLNDWLKELPQWNNLILRWFKLELENNDLIVDFINNMGYLVINIDGNLMFCFTQVSSLNRLLRIIKQTAKKQNYYIDLKLNSLHKEFY